MTTETTRVGSSPYKACTTYYHSVSGVHAPVVVKVTLVEHVGATMWKVLVLRLKDSGWS